MTSGKRLGDRFDGREPSPYLSSSIPPSTRMAGGGGHAIHANCAGHNRVPRLWLIERKSARLAAGGAIDAITCTSL